MKERYEKFLSWFIKELERNPKQVIDQIEHVGKIDYPRRYDQKRFDALDMIKWDLMLKHLKVLD